MKRLVCAVFILNLCLIGLGDYFQPQRMVFLKNGQGRLPRVSDLRVNQVRPTDDAPVSRAVQNGPERYCGRISGFNSLHMAKVFIRESRGLFDRATIETAAAPAGKPLFWVVVPPLASQKKALALLARLQRAGVDSYLVAEGKYRYAISLGLFNSRRQAREVTAQFQEQNIAPVVIPMPRDERRYTLVFEVPGRSDLPAIDSQLTLYNHRLELVNFQSCQGVATSDKSP